MGDADSDEVRLPQSGSLAKSAQNISRFAGDILIR